ncbi:MAG: gliding motility-associated C-terminal domain-containing protein [Saprospiraceae bacterium]|nr:gliding motility-associated C-terminal domain-containing protein [Saprospiraceae bacterium]
MKRLIYWLSFFGLLLPWGLYAQLPVACTGGNPAVLCDQACIFCNFDGYVGSTQGYPSGPATDFCGTVENAQWIGFIAGLAEATFTVYPTDCNTGDGVQIALYEDCTKPPLACDKGMEKGGMTPVSIKAALTPGRNYFLLIDGYAGDQCDFSVEVSPKEAVYEPPLGMVQNIQGKIEGCPGATFTYAIPPVAGAGAYIWDGPPGTLVDSMPVPATILGSAGTSVQITLGTQSGNLCVQAANSCQANPPCSGTLFVTILDDTHRPALIADSVAHLTCTGSPARLLFELDPPANYTFAWTADSLGHIVSGETTEILRVDKTGNYTLVATNTVTGCSSSGTIRVGEPDIPSAADITIQHISCYGKEDGILRIGAVTGGTAPYMYSLDEAPFVSTPEYLRLLPGDHALVIQGIDGCELDTSITMLQPEELLLDLDPDTTIHLGQEIALWRDAALNYPDRKKQVLVNPMQLVDMLCDTCMYQPVNSFRYEVTVLDSNGCRASDERTIVVDKYRQVYIPNVFAPDSPFENAVFRLQCGQDVEKITTFRVYNRWGRSIVEQNNLEPNDPTMGWDGRINGEKAPPAVFVYFAEVQFRDGETVQYRGDITLIR